MDFTKISCVLHEPKPGVESGEKFGDKSEKIKNWEMANTLCLNTILNSLSNELFDVYCHFTIAKELWDELIGRYVIEDEGIKKLVTSNFLYFQMTNEKNISSQIDEYHNIVADWPKRVMYYPKVL